MTGRMGWRVAVFFAGTEGSVAMEYGLLLVCIAVLLVAAMVGFRESLDPLYRDAVAHLLTGS